MKFEENPSKILNLEIWKKSALGQMINSINTKENCLIARYHFRDQNSHIPGFLYFGASEQSRNVKICSCTKFLSLKSNLMYKNKIASIFC